MPLGYAIDKQSNKTPTKYVAKHNNFRLQLKAIGDKIDMDTGRILKGETMSAQFKNALFITNIPEYIKLIEASDSFKNGDVKVFDDLVKEAKDKRYKELLSLAMDDPELKERLAKDLSKEVKPTQVSKEEAEKQEESLRESFVK